MGIMIDIPGKVDIGKYLGQVFGYAIVVNNIQYRIVFMSVKYSLL